MVAIDRERIDVSQTRDPSGDDGEPQETSGDVLTTRDVRTRFKIPESSQKKARAAGSFAPYFKVGRRVYYRRAALEAWIAEQERQQSSGHHGSLKGAQ